jgi:hypothetical protein
MSKVISLIKQKRDSESVSLAELEQQAKERFKSLALLVNCEWNDSEWRYKKGSQKVNFQQIGGENLPVEIAVLSKVFLVDILWKQRLRPEPYSYGYVADLLIPFKIWAEKGLEHLSDITQDTYHSTIVYLRDRYAEPAPYGVRVNKAVSFLNENNLLNAHIDTLNIQKSLGKTDEQGRVLAKKEKMPTLELVKAVVHLKWAVEDSFDGSARAVSDKLSILTQVFQYGLGLRLGEVLRLPKDPLREIDGETFCLVWAEKGSAPMARYVPTIWRKPLADAVGDIHKLTKPYRDIAIEIEQQGAVSFLDERIEALNQEREAWLSKKVAELDALLDSNKQTASELWTLKKPVEASLRYELKDLNQIFPIPSSASGASSLVKYYQKLGFEIISEPLGTFKHKHYVTGKEIQKVVAGYIEKRASHVTLREFLTLINPNRSEATVVSKDKHVKAKTERLRGRPNFLTFADDSYLEGGTSIVVISRENVLSILKAFAFGGYDQNRYISLKDLENLLPELLNQKSANKDYVLEFCGHKKVKFYKWVDGGSSFRKVEGYLAEIEKVKEFFMAEYFRMNYDVERELINESTNEYEADGIEISSKSFSIKQQPSENLFIRAGMRGGVYFDHLPQILGYNAVSYFFGGNDRQDNGFSRYGVDVEDYVTESWQSHKGRHWQTTSLFRAGLAEIVVNKWMGRTTGQGDNYDHNTGKERAKVVGDAMLEDTERFLGDVPDKVRAWKQKTISTDSMSDYLTETLQSVQYGPLGYCTRALYLKPCEFNLKCLTGNDGKGCKHYIYDLLDPSHREKIAAERDKSSLELSRLFEVYERGVEAAKMHIEHHMIIVRNTTSILDNAEIILEDGQLEDLRDYMPFKKNGSYPDDCPFQCGGDD